MELMDRQGSGSLSTFMMGAVVGAGIALLFAPQAGGQMRRLLTEYLAQAKDEFDKTMDHGTEMLHSAVEQGKGALRETGHQGKEAAETFSPSVSKTPDGDGAKAPALRWADLS